MIKILHGLTLLMASAIGGTLAFAEEKKPNLVIFLTDDQGYNDLACYGSDTVKTPHADQLAKEGMKFTNAYVGSPVCGPSRASLMTGCYPMRIAEAKSKKQLHTVPHTKEVLIPELLKPQGYQSALLGKWHLGTRHTGSDPNGQGFDYFYGTPKFNGAVRIIEESDFRASVLRNHDVIIPVVEQAEMDQLTTLYTEEAVKFITENKENPFFLCIAHSMPHVPLGVSDKYRGKSKGGLYGDVIEELDWSLGEVMKCLKENELDENTLVVFVSDNGPWIEDMIGDHAGSATPLKGSKMTSWEGGPRVPCIMRWTGRITAGVTSDAIVTTMDLFPTIGKLAGAKFPENTVLDGRDIMPLLSGETQDSPHDYYYYYCYKALHAVRNDRWKLVAPRKKSPKWMGWWGRMIEAVDDYELYDLHNDLGEKNNVIKDNPEVAELLKSQLTLMKADLGDGLTPGAGMRSYFKTKKKSAK